MKRVIHVILCVMTVILGCGLVPSHAETIQIASSIYPITDIIRQIGGDRVKVITIITPGTNPHTFEPKPSLVKDISTSKIWFMIGAGLEFWAEKFINVSNTRIKTVVLSDGISLIRTVEKHDHHSHSESHPTHAQTHKTSEHKEESEFANPHIWLDPEIVKIMVGKIQDALKELDSAYSEQYHQNAQQLIKNLDQLSRDIREAVTKFSIKKYVTFHPAWDYFSRQYGLECVGVIESAPGRNPSPKHIRQLVDQIRQYGIKAVFAEPQFNPKIAEVVAKEAGVQVLLLDPLGGPDLKDRDTYINLMKYNLRILEEGMK